MNESMHEMYKLRSLQPGDEQGAEQAKDPITSGEELKGRSMQSTCLCLMILDYQLVFQACPACFS